MVDTSVPGADTAPLASFIAGGAGTRPLTGGALRAIRLHLGMEVAFVSEFTGGRRVFRYVDGETEGCRLRVGEGGPLEESYCQRVVDGRLPSLMHDATTVPAALELPATTELPVGAHLSVPIHLADGRVYGTLCCFSTRPDTTLTDRDVAVLRVFAALAAEQIDAELEQQRVVAERRARMEAAIGGEGMSIVFQPIVDIDTRREVGYEALARFQAQPAQPAQPPDSWFAEAAAAGFGVELELAAVRMALREVDALPPSAYLALNVSPETVVSGRLHEALGEAGSHRLVLEITEHVAIEAYETLETALAELRRDGLLLAVDDAGAGYASFRHILRLRPDVIKLDVTLTRDIDSDRPRRALAFALMAFARDTGSAIVAEGVETAAELRTLELLGANAAQGFYLGRPRAPVRPPGDAALTLR